MNSAVWGAKTQLGHQNLVVNNIRQPVVKQWPIKVDPTAHLRYFPGQQHLYHYYRALSSRSIIFSGGSILNSNRDIQLKRQLIKLTSPQLARAVGVSLGPFDSIDAEQQCQAFLNECGFIGVRDHESLSIANTLAPDANVHLTFDLALCLAQSLPTLSTFRRGIGLNICPTPIDCFGTTDQLKEQHKLNQAIELIRTLWLEHGLSTTLIDFNAHPKFGDSQCHKSIYHQLKSELPIRYRPYNGDLMSLIQTLSSLQVVIGMHLHCGILSYMSDTPFVSLKYQPKCLDWCQQIGMGEQYHVEAEDYNPVSLANLADGIISFGFQSPKMSINQAYQRAMINWK